MKCGIVIKFGHIVLLLLILLYGCIWDTLGLRKPNPLPTSFTVILDDTLSFIANIFFLILLIEQLNFSYTICLIKLLIFCFILEFLIRGGGRKIRSMVLQVIMIYHFMVDTVYVCILTERVYYIVLYYVRHYLTKQKRIHWEKQRSMERERESNLWAGTTVALHTPKKWPPSTV